MFRLSILKKIFNNFFNSKKSITLVDIGAQGGLEPRWRGLDGYINYCGVEPDSRSNIQLAKKVTNFNEYTIIPYALWSSSKDLLLNQCRQPSASSIFKPNKVLLDKFPNADRFDIQKTIQIQAKKLDEVFNGNVDFLKIDTQGAELEIIKGSVERLCHAIGLEVEVQFHKIYNDEPLFHDVSLFLEAQKFEFIDFIHLKRWGRHKLDNRGQLIFADALFLRSPEFILEKDSLELCEKYIGICLIYNRFDYIKIILDSHFGINKISSKSKIYIRFLECLYNITFILTRGVSNLQRKVHSNYRSHFLY